jgi:O-succinylbenzoic acid--CoA ligase
MTPHFSKIHNRFKFNGNHFNYENLKEVAYSLVKEGKSYERVTGDFLLDWLNADDFIFVKTSGSTGQPKTIRLQKKAMVHSAIATGNFFSLKPGDKAIDSLPSHYIAGKMMLVRAMVLGLEIDCVAPSAHPVFNYETQYDFCAMVPLQLKNIIKHTQNIKIIIIGGSRITKPLLEKIANATSLFYETYGMTETVTHVALKRLESKAAKGESDFKALPEITFKQDDRQCLIIQAPNLVGEDLVTNDRVELSSETGFTWLGRYDNIINSGGVKLFPEQIEEKLQSVINERFIFASEPDTDLGEKLILIIENPSDSVDSFQKRLRLIKGLTKFELPKKIYTVAKFNETANGKVQRKKTISSVLG